MSSSPPPDDPGAGQAPDPTSGQPWSTPSGDALAPEPRRPTFQPGYASIPDPNRPTRSQHDTTRLDPNQPGPNQPDATRLDPQQPDPTRLDSGRPPSYGPPTMAFPPVPPLPAAPPGQSAYAPPVPPHPAAPPGQSAYAPPVPPHPAAGPPGQPNYAPPGQPPDYGQNQQAGYPPPGYPQNAQNYARPGYPPPPGRPRRRSNIPLVAVIVAVTLLLCGGVATAGVLIARNVTDRAKAAVSDIPTALPELPGVPTDLPTLPTGGPDDGIGRTIDVTYEVSGDGPVRILYVAKLGESPTRLENVSLPWRFEATMETPALLTVVAMRLEASEGSITCRALVDDEVVREKTSEPGNFATASCTHFALD